MDMLYYIYIGSNRATIDHLSKVTGGMFMAVSSCNKATKVIDGIRERYNTSILYEQSNPQKDCENITFLHKRFPRVYIILVTEELQKENRKLYLQAGVNNTLSPTTHEGNLQQMTKFLQLRKEHKLQEFSQSHRKIFNTFHLPVWKRIFDILFAVAVLIALSPIFIVTAIAIRMESKGKVIYKSQRVGSNYQIFNFLKFRSMYTNADKRLKELNALNQYKTDGRAARYPLRRPDRHFRRGGYPADFGRFRHLRRRLPQKEGPRKTEYVRQDRERSPRHPRRPFHPQVQH